RTSQGSLTAQRNFTGVTLERVSKKFNSRLQSSSQSKTVEIFKIDQPRPKPSIKGVHVDRVQSARRHFGMIFLRSLSSDNSNGSSLNSTDRSSDVHLGVPYNTINKTGLLYPSSPSYSFNQQSSATKFPRESLQRRQRLRLQQRQRQQQQQRRQLQQQRPQRQQRPPPPLQQPQRPQPRQQQQRQRPPPPLQQPQQPQLQQQRPQRQQPRQQPQQRRQPELQVSNNLNK
ncbi:unnamed protein product, partial [Rotaria magnacalcarata]